MQESEQASLFMEEHLEIKTKPLSSEEIALIETHVCSFCLHFSQGIPVFENHTGATLYHRGNCHASEIEAEHFPTISITGRHCSRFTRKKQ